MTDKEKYILEILAVYEMADMADIGNAYSTIKYHKNIMTSLVKNKYIRKATYKTRTSGQPERSKHLENLRKVMQQLERSKNNSITTRKNIALLKKAYKADWKQIADSNINIKIYKLTEKGKRYIESLGYPKKADTNKDEYTAIRRKQITTEIACKLAGSIMNTEIIPTEENIRKAIEDERTYFIPSHVAKEMRSDIGRGNRAIGVLHGPDIAYAIFHDGNAKMDVSSEMRHIKNYNESIISESIKNIIGRVETYSLSDMRLCSYMPKIRGMIYFTTSSKYIPVIREKLITTKDKRAIDYESTHILELNDSGLFAAATLTHSENWHELCIEKVLPEEEIKYNIKDRWRYADAMWKDKYVFVLISNELMRMSVLMDITIGGGDLRNCVIICLKTQKDFYSDQKLFPGATVITMPELHKNLKEIREV